MTKQEFKTLFEQYYNPLCNFANTILFDSNRAEDAVQDIFVKMWQKKDTVGELDNVKSYLFMATRNKCIEFLRKLKLDRKLSEENERRLEMSSKMNIDEEADKFVLKEKLFNSIRQLPPKCRDVFTMSKINGLTYSEIADELGISPKTVDNQMGRAMRLLREMMKTKN